MKRVTLLTSMLLIFIIPIIAYAEFMKVLILKEIDDDHVIVVTEKGDQLLLEKWSLKFSPLSFEGKTFIADVTSSWVKMYIENKGEIKWSVEKSLGTVDLQTPSQKSDTSKQKVETAKGYLIEVSHNDELFIINGEKYEAKTYCLGWEQGERVMFLEGSALGVCTSAKLLNLNRNEVCEVWCE